MGCLVLGCAAEDGTYVKKMPLFKLGVAIDPTCINIEDLTLVTNIMRFKWEVT